MKPKTELEKLQVLKLIQCVQDDKFKDIKRLWENGVSGILNLNEPKDGKTALIKAIELNKEQMVSDLIELGADPNVPDLSEKTPIMYACELGHHLIVEEFSKLDINFNKIDNVSNTALTYCLSSPTKRP